MKKHQIVDLIYEKAMEMPIGSCFSLSEAVGPIWGDFDPYTRRQACKEFKIAVATKEIKGVIFLEKRSNGTYVYKRI